MKTILTLLIVGALCVTSRAGTSAMLCGIRIVETQDKPYPPRGKLGERGPYQFRRGTWRMHTSSSFDLAENRDVANTVAKRHYAWIEAQLKAKGIEPSPYNVAMAWNAGVNAVIRGRVPAVARDYATRVLNIAGTMTERMTPTPTPEPTPPPKPIWSAPILVAEETAKPQTPVTVPIAVAPIAVPTPASVEASPVISVASNEPAAQSDLIEVRFHSDPIMLAFSQSSTPESVNEMLPAPTEVTANAMLLAQLSDPSRHLQLSALTEKLVPGVGVEPTRL